jgi:hypothetical protein
MSKKITASIQERIRNTIAIDDSGCWIWKASVGRSGYGRLRMGGKTREVHRLAYEAYRGPIPEGLEIDHLCRVRRCVNPDHLDLVTHAENVRRGLVGSRERSRTHCPYGHPYDESNTYVKGGGRHCRACKARRAAEVNRRKVEANAAKGPRVACRRGHLYDVEAPEVSGLKRYCKVCQKMKMQEWLARRKSECVI